VAVQSGSLWRNPCIGDTLAGNYRVGDYNVDYSAQESHTAEQGQAHHGYESSGHHPQHRQSLLHTPVQSQSHHHGTSSSHHPVMPQHHTHHAHQVLMEPLQIGHVRHLGPSHYGPPGSVITPLYPSLTTPTHSPHLTQHTNQSHMGSVKRHRPDDLDLAQTGITGLEPPRLEAMQNTPIDSYEQPQQPPTHHHHHLPDTGPPTKMMRREGDMGGAGAPSVVGQAGMPSPALRPRGPKLKFTPEDDQLLIDLKEHKSLTWKQIADFFPGRSSGTLQVRYCTKLKAKTTQWTDETVRFDSRLTLCKSLFRSARKQCPNSGLSY
jgi:hypothetical protein